MPYQIVKLPAGAQTGLVRIVREQIDPLLRDVHAMLMLPRKDIPGLNAGCNLAVSLVLLNVVSGVSATLYDDPSLGDVDPRNQSGEAFRRVLERHYPWDEEPNVEGAIRERHAATVFYDAFRNPLTHTLGIVLPDEDHGHGQRKVAKGAMSDKKIEDIETSEPRPLRWSRPTLSTDGLEESRPDQDRHGRKAVLRGRSADDLAGHRSPRDQRRAASRQDLSDIPHRPDRRLIPRLPRRRLARVTRPYGGPHRRGRGADDLRTATGRACPALSV